MNSSSRVSPPARRSWTAACLLVVVFNPLVGLAAPNPRPTRLQPKSQEASEAAAKGDAQLGAVALAERPVEGVRFVEAQRDVQGVQVAGLESRTDPVAPADLAGEELEAWKTRANDAGPELKTFFPSRYSDPFVVEGDGVRVAIRPVGGSAAGAQVDNGRLVFRGAYNQTDSIHRVDSGRSEEILLLHDESAPTQFDYEIVSVEGATQVFQHNGGIRFADAKGRGLEIEPPWLVDGSSRRSDRAARWHLREKRLTLTVSLEELVFPIAVDPTWSTANASHVRRYGHTATLLGTGELLVVGGVSNSGLAVVEVEINNPATGRWRNAGSLSNARYHHTATLLRNGKVLVVGGDNSVTGAIASAEIFDPATNQWSITGALAQARSYHTATRLTDGRVLVTGGNSSPAELDSCEIYDPSSGQWSNAASLPELRSRHTSTLLSNGQVLVAGGTSVAFTRLYVPGSDQWVQTGQLNTARVLHGATLLSNGRVLVVGGLDALNSGAPDLASAELYNPSTGLWTFTGSLSQGRTQFSMSLLPDGRALVVAGGTSSLSYFATAEAYDPTTGLWSGAGSVSSARIQHTATVLANGRVAVVGGVSNQGPTSSTSILDLTSWQATPTMSLPMSRYNHSAILLPSGKVLVIGDDSISSDCVLFNPTTAQWEATGSLAIPRFQPMIVLLTDGRVLAAGGLGSGGALSSTEIYDPNSGLWTAGGNMNTPRISTKAVVLSNGRILVAGGETDSGGLTTAEIYEPAVNSWASTGSMSIARYDFSATLLTDGHVLIAGGRGSSGAAISAELFDPNAGQWTRTGDLNEQFVDHTATLLRGGKVLVVGGVGTDPTQPETFDPVTGEWSKTGVFALGPQGHTATLLFDGRVAVVGGAAGGVLGTVSVFDPVTGLWTTVGSLQQARLSHTTTLLPSGDLLVVGGHSATSPLASVESCSLEANYVANRPVVTALPSSFVMSEAISISGSGFQGVSEASGGTHSASATNHPVVQLRSLASDAIVSISSNSSLPWSATSFDCAETPALTPGYALLTVTCNGLRSAARFIRADLPAAPTGLVAVSRSASRIDLAWQDTTPNETGFLVERRLAAGVYADVATLGADVESFQDIGLLSGSTYSYRVRAFNFVTSGAESNEASATTAGCAFPTIAGQPQSQVVQSSQFAVLGVAATGAEPLSYQWYQQTSPGVFTPVGGATGTTYDTGPLTSTSVYKVRVTDQCGSVDSDVATVTVELAVSNPGDSGAGTLREAITRSNMTPGIETIQFNFPGNGVHTITLTGQPLQITAPVIIDGRSQPGYVGTPLIELRGTYDGIAPPPDCLGTDGDDGLHFTSTAAGSEVRGLVINGFTGDGIEFEGGGDETHRNLVVGCYIGTNAAGSAAIRNRRHGIFINAAAWCRIGGVRIPDGTLKDGCLISGNRCSGIEIRGGLAGHNEVIGSNIGTNLMATGGIGNNIGIHIDGAPDNTIGAAGDDASKKNQCGYNNGGGVVNSGTVNTNPNGSGPPNTVILGTVFTGNDGGAIIGGIGPTPQIASAGLSSTTLSIAGTLQFPPEEGGSKQYRIQYFGNTSCATGGQGEVLLAADVLKLSSPTGLLDLAFSSASTTVRPGELVALTVTGPGGTSNFSACVPVTGALQVTAQRSGTVGFSAILGPHGAAHDIPNTITPGLSRSFAGPGDPDNPDVSEDEVVPPDPQGAVGLSHVVAVTNVDITIQNKTSGAVIDSATLDGLWASLKLAPAEELSTFNPRAAYDPYGQRFIVAACANPRKANSSVLVAVSRTSDPTGEWNVYRYDAEGANLLWADYPTLGFTKDWIAVQVNMSSIAFSDTILRSEVYLVDKAAMYAGTPGTGKATVLGSASLGRTQVPAMTFDPALGTLYLLQTAEGNVGGFGKLNSFIISGPVGSESMAVGPVFQTPRTWFSPSQIPPDLAPQLGSPVKIAVNDTRMHSVIYRNGKLYAAHTVLLPAAGPTPTLSGVQWYELNPANGTVVQDGRVSDESGLVFYAYPALAVNAAGNMILGYSRFSATTFASAAYRFRESGDAAGTLSGEQMLKSGLAKYDKTLGFGANRWGDYSTAAVDPSDNATFWLLNEYAAMPRIGTATTDQWGTWWGSVDGSTQCTFACSANIAVGTGAGSLTCGKVVTYPAPTLTGTCGTVTCVPASGTSFPVGTTTVTCSDGAGHGCSFTVTVTDDTVPAITCPANQTATASGPQGVAVNYPAPTVTDNCPGASVNCSPASGSVFPVGVTVVNCTASDASSNTAGCSFTVTVTDGTAQTADLSVVGFQAIVPAGVSPLVVYQVTARNLGPSQASGATLVNTLPTGTTYAGSMASQGSISAPALGSPGTVTVNFGPIPAGGSATATVLITVVSPLLSITNNVSVSSSTSDPIPSNNTASLVTPVNFAPGAPSSLTATAISASQINLAWLDNSVNESNFFVDRKTGAGGTWGLVATLGPNTTSYASVGLSMATTYFYRVRAANANGESANSNEASATTLTSGPTELVANGSFESGATSWTQTPGTIINNSGTGAAFDGTWKATILGAATVTTHTLYQTPAFPSTGASKTLRFQMRIQTAETIGFPYDKLFVRITNSAGTTLTTLATYSNANSGTYANYGLVTLTIPAQYAVSGNQLRFVATSNFQLATTFYIDAVSVQ